MRRCPWRMGLKSHLVLTPNSQSSVWLLFFSRFPGSWLNARILSARLGHRKCGVWSELSHLISLWFLEQMLWFSASVSLSGKGWVAFDSFQGFFSQQHYVIYAFVARILSIFAYQYGRDKSLSLSVSRFTACLRLGFLETDSDMQSQVRKFIGSGSQEIHIRGWGRRDWAGVDLRSSCSRGLSRS